MPEMKEETAPKNGAERLITRAAASWFAADWIMFLTGSGKFTKKDFLADRSILVFLLIAAAFFGIFSLLTTLYRAYRTSASDPVPDRFCLTAVAILTSLAAVYKNVNVAFTCVMTALTCFLICWTVPAVPAPKKGGALLNGKRGKAVGITLTAAAALFYAAFVGTMTVCRYLNYVTPNFDFGLFVNMFYRMKTTGLPLITSERDRLLSHFAVHFSPAYYLVLPFYMIFPSPVTLQLAQAFLIASGAIPVYLIAKKKGISPVGAGCAAIVYALWPAMSGGCFYDMHENMFLAPFLLWTFFFFEADKPIPMYVFALLTCSVKEDAPVYVAFFALYVLLSGRDRKGVLHGTMLLALSVLWFLGATWYLNKYGLGVMSYRYEDYISGGGGLFEVIVTVIKNPLLVFNNIVKKENLEFIGLTAVPLCALPFVTGRPSRLILVCPYLLINLMPSYQYQHSIYFQYVFGAGAFLVYATALNLADMKPEVRRRAIPCVVCASLLFFASSTYAQKGYYYRSYLNQKEDNAKIAEVLKAVPDDASVRCSTFFLAHIADRDEIYALKTDQDTDYCVLDLRYDTEYSKGGDLEAFLKEGWEIVAIEEDLAAVLKAPETVPIP